MLDFEQLVSGFQFVEAPRVDCDGTLYFSDLIGGGVYRRTVDGTVATVLPDRLWAGGIVINRDGGLICAGRGGLIRLDVASGAQQPLLSDIRGQPIVAVNDIEAAPDGGIYGGTADFAAVMERGEAPAPGYFFHLSPQGTLTILRDDIVVSNGIGYSPDGQTLYHSESTVGIWAYRLDGGVMPRDPSLLIPLADSDGLAVDVDGGIWVACWETARLLRFNPDGILDICIDLPFPNVVSLDFGGTDGRDLFVSTGGSFGEGQPPMGGIVRIRTTQAGLASRKANF